MPSLIQKHAHVKGQISNHHISNFSQIHRGPKNGQTVTRPLSSIGPVVSEEKMFENLTNGLRTDIGVIGILIAHLGAFGSGELNIQRNLLCFLLYIVST